MRFPLSLLCCVLLPFVAGGCGRKEDARSPSASTEAGAAKAALQRVVLQTDWFPQAEHGGFYQALAKGFYADAGLDVQILPGGPGAGIKLKVARGDADFGMLKSDDVIVAASRGMPFTLVMATMQHDPQAVMVHESSPVRTIPDLNGRVVIASPSMTWIPYVQKKYGIKFDLKPNVYGLGEFLATPDAIQQCLVTNEPYFARKNGRAVRTVSLAESGYDCYPSVFCRQEFARKSPALVRAFAQASIRGWRDYLESDPSPAHQLILARNPQTSAEFLAFSREQLIARRLVHGDAAKGEDIGRLERERIAGEIRTLIDLKILDAPVALESVLSGDFSNPK